MRKIALPSHEGFDAKALLRAIVASPTRRDTGLSLEDVRRAVKILEILDKGTETILLEDADWQFVRAKVESASYLVADRRVVDFADSVIKAVQIDVTEA